MWESLLLITRAIVYACAVAVAVLGLAGIATNDVGYLVPVLFASAPAWTAVIVMYPIHRRYQRRELRGWKR